MILVTGGAGFIGSNFVLDWLAASAEPVVTTNCSNNYGPWQFPEKLIPLCIHRAVAGESLPIYGDGRQIRDWLSVGDHCAAIRRVLEAGRPGEVYCIGGSSEMANLDVVTRLCWILDEEQPRADCKHYAAESRPWQFGTLVASGPKQRQLVGRAGGRAQPPVIFDWKSWLTMQARHTSSKSAGGEHVPPPGGLGLLRFHCRSQRVTA